MKNFKITSKFLIISGIIVSFLLIGFAFFLTQQSISRAEEVKVKQIKELNESLSRKEIC